MGASKETILEFVTFDHLVLSGIFEMPLNQKAIALILQGSGNVGTDGDVSSPVVGFSSTPIESGSTKLSQQLAKNLLKTNISSFRFGKRGVDDPSQVPNQTIPNLVSDAMSAIQMLQTNFTGTPIILVGFSEGAMIAQIVATKINIDACFLFAPPTRPIHEVVNYQFLKWPVTILSKKSLDYNLVQGSVNPLDFRQVESGRFPLLGAPIPKNPNIDEIKKLYLDFSARIEKMLESPSMVKWHQSMKEVPRFLDLLALSKARKTVIYQGEKDAQIDPAWILSDSPFFPERVHLHPVFKDLGHCFSPMAGIYGEIKTTGPIAEVVIDVFCKDILSLYPNTNISIQTHENKTTHYEYH